MYKPTSDAHHFLKTFQSLAQVFGLIRAEQFYRHANYYAYRDNRDFYNVLNEIPEVLEYVESISKYEPNGFKHYFGISWGVKNRE